MWRMKGRKTLLCSTVYLYSISFKKGFVLVKTPVVVFSLQYEDSNLFEMYTYNRCNTIVCIHYFKSHSQKMTYDVISRTPFLAARWHHLWPMPTPKKGVRDIPTPIWVYDICHFSDSAHDTFISFILWYFHAFEKFCLLTVYVELSAYQGVQRVLYNDDWSGHRPGLRDYITRACNSNWLWSGMKCTMHGWSRRGGFRLFEIITWQQTVIGPRCIYASIDMVVQNYEINRYKSWHP